MSLSTGNQETKNFTVREFCDQANIGRANFCEELADGRLKTALVERKRLISYQQHLDWLEAAGLTG